MDTQLIRHLVNLASRAPMSEYERYCFNQHAQLLILECERAEKPPQEAEKSGEQKASDVVK